MQVVLGRLFISLARHPAFTDQIIAGLRLARLIQATSYEGELQQPLIKSTAEFQSSYRALVEHVANYARASGKNAPNLVMSPDPRE